MYSTAHALRTTSGYYEPSLANFKKNLAEGRDRPNQGKWALKSAAFAMPVLEDNKSVVKSTTFPSQMGK